MAPKFEDGPGWRDWLLVVVSAAFVVIGVVILPTARNVGIVNIAFFGLCAAVGIMTIRRKLRARDLSDTLDVEVVGGIPIRQSRSQPLLLGGAVAALGIILIAFGGEMGPVLQLLGGVIAACGFGIVIGIAAGWFGTGALLFDPQGLAITSRKFSYRVPWDLIAEIGTGEFSSNPVLVMRLHDQNAVAAQPVGSTEALRRHFASNERWVGAPVLIMPAQYGLDLPVLEKAVARYAFEPRTRAELAKRHLK